MDVDVDGELTASSSNLVALRLLRFTSDADTDDDDDDDVAWNADGFDDVGDNKCLSLS